MELLVLIRRHALKCKDHYNMLNQMYIGPKNILLKSLKKHAA